MEVVKWGALITIGCVGLLIIAFLVSVYFRYGAYISESNWSRKMFKQKQRKNGRATEKDGKDAVSNF